MNLADKVCSVSVALQREKPELRRGQAMFLALHHIRPDLASWVTAKDIDPFYDDSKIVAFLDQLSGWQLEV